MSIAELERARTRKRPAKGKMRLNGDVYKLEKPSQAHRGRFLRGWIMSRTTSQKSLFNLDQRLRVHRRFRPDKRQRYTILRIRA